MYHGSDRSSICSIPHLKCKYEFYKYLLVLFILVIFLSIPFLLGISLDGMLKVIFRIHFNNTCFSQIYLNIRILVSNKELITAVCRNLFLQLNGMRCKAFKGLFHDLFTG